MTFLPLLMTLLVQVTPPPPPPVLATPQASPSVSPSLSPAPSAAPAELTLSSAAVNLYPSQAQTINIQNGAGPYVATVDTPLVTVTIDQNAKTLTVTAAQQTGRATITVNDSTGAAAQIPVRVALDAGTPPAAVTLRITGTEPQPQWVAQLVQKAILRQTQMQPGASAQVGSFTLPPSIGPGASAVVPVPVHIAGGDTYFDVNAWPSITLQNIAADPFSPPVLFYDDDPEKITANGVLFRGHVSAGTPARLYYYHQNTVDQRQLAVVVTTAAAQPSSVQLIDASAGPNIDVMSVGHAVSRDFLLQKPLNEGIVVDVSAQTPYVADQFTMNRLDGAAGSIGVRVLDGGPVTVTVVALPPGPVSDTQIAAFAAQPQLPGDGHHRTGAFLLAGYANEAIAFTAPGPDASTQYGAQTPPAAAVPNDPVATGHDYGEYGVLRTLDFNIANPGETAATLYLYERPLGGVVRSSFLVDGRLAEVGCARVSDRYQIGDPITVQPHANLALPVLTMTDGGSNYPLEVGITATPPLPAVPGITAPNGCFPRPAPASTPSPQAPR